MRAIPLLCLLLFCAPSVLWANPDATRIVTEAYEDVLGRKPDENGLRQYRSQVIERGWTAEDVRQDLRKSNEYVDKVIQSAFEDVLGRKADPGALATYRHALQKKGWTERDLRNELRKSDEYKQKNRSK